MLCLPVSPDSVRLAGWKVLSPGAPDIALKKSQTMDIRVDKLFQLPYQGVSYIVACNGVATPPKQAVGPELVLHEVIKVHGFSNF